MSKFRNSFVLKGALLFFVWEEPGLRPTRDIDLLGLTSNSVDNVVRIVKEICRTDVAQDGITFDESTVTGDRITEGADYEGVRVILRGNLGKTRIRLQLDVGFGDVIVPGAENIQYASILGFPEPILLGYSRESTIAEKFEAMVKLGVISSRMKDFYDIWLLSNHFDFSGTILSEAISKTFNKRRTELPSNIDEFIRELKSDPAKDRQWKGFIRKNKLEDAPSELDDVLDAILSFLSSPVKKLTEGQAWKSEWKKSGPWTE